MSLKKLEWGENGELQLQVCDTGGWVDTSNDACSPATCVSWVSPACACLLLPRRGDKWNERSTLAAHIYISVGQSQYDRLCPHLVFFLSVVSVNCVDVCAVLSRPPLCVRQQHVGHLMKIMALSSMTSESVHVRTNGCQKNHFSYTLQAGLRFFYYLRIYFISPQLLEF